MSCDCKDAWPAGIAEVVGGDVNDVRPGCVNSEGVKACEQRMASVICLIRFMSTRNCFMPSPASRDIRRDFPKKTRGLRENEFKSF